MSEPGSALPAAAREECPEQPRHGKRGAPQAFARKLAEILATESTSIVAWNESGSVFRVVDVERFSQDVLVKHYRHSKFSSFQRQLNLYQFRKIVKGVDAGGYQHPMFHRDRPEDLCHVRRSVSGSGRYDASAAKASAKRTAAALSQRQQGKAGGEGWAASAVTTAPRVRKSSTATRRVGKLRDRAVESRVPAPYGGANTIFSPVAVPAAGGMGADHRQAAVALSRQQQQVVAAPRPNSDAGERSPWTSGESSDSDVSVDGGAAAVTTAAAERWTSNNEQPGSAGAGAAAASSDDGEEAEAEDSSSSDSDGVGGTAAGEGGARRHAQAASDMRRERLQGEEAGEEPLLPRTGGPAAAANGGAGGGSVSPAGSRKSPFNFFKKTFSFIERSNSHRRGMSASNDGGGATAPERPMPSSSSNLGSSSSSSGGGSGSGVPVSTLMVDTSAAARAAAAGVGIGASGRGVRPPPVTVSGGVGHRAAMDASGNKVLTSSMSPLTPKSSMEAAALAAAAATAAMPPPPRREQREELGLVEQLTNMVEVFDICDLLRKVSTSNSSRLDKHGGIVKPKSPHHLRNMSVDTDQGLPQSPLQGRQGQSPTGLGSLASMELVRDSSKDWDTLMAGSADVSDIGNTMVQSVAEFFSF